MEGRMLVGGGRDIGETTGKGRMEGMRRRDREVD